MNEFKFSRKFGLETQTENTEELSQSHIEQPGSSQSIKTVEATESVKERISDHLKYKKLKLKEYLGQLSQEDFDQLLDFDFQEQLKNNPPIAGVFSPEDELAKIKKLPREQKREALASFKENLARQREVLAACRVFIERSIKFNHDIPRKKLIELTEQFGAQYGFNDKQKQIIEQLIDRYYKNRQKVLEIRREFTDNRALVNRLTGVNLDKNEKFEISVGPMTIDIDADKFAAERLLEKSDNPVIVSRFGGFASQSAETNPIYYTVINHGKYMQRGMLKDPALEKTRKHEHEHQKNTLFSAIFEFPKPKRRLLGYIDQENHEVKKIILEDFFAKNRAFALERTRDEITACLCSMTLPELQGRLDSLFFKQKDPAYDYLAYLRNWEIFRDDHLYQETAQKMLVREYRAIIERAVSSYAELVNKGKYSTQEAIALLTDKPLTDWPKTISRLLEQKMKGLK